MSGSMNQLILIGNLGKDPEIKMTTTGTQVARFSLATTDTWKNAKGEKQSKTQWHNIIVWGKQAELAEKYLRKGKQISVVGRVEYREYTDQANIKRNITEIRCDNFVMLGKADGQRPDSTPGHDEDLPSSPAAGGYDDSEIPF